MPTPADDPDQHAGARSQTDVVVQGIKRLITRGDLRPGSRLPIEKELAESFGVSRGSLREAVRSLCLMGVLETRQGDGTYVTSLDSRLLLAPMSFMVDLQAPEHRRDLHAVRRVLETEAAALSSLSISEQLLDAASAALDAAEQLIRAPGELDYDAILATDLDFHRAIAQGADNPALSALIDALADRTLPARLWAGVHDDRRVRIGHDEHLAILAAVRSHQPDRARLLMAHHLLDVEDRVAAQPVDGER